MNVVRTRPEARRQRHQLRSLGLGRVVVAESREQDISRCRSIVKPHIEGVVLRIRLLVRQVVVGHARRRRSWIEVEVVQRGLVLRNTSRRNVIARDRSAGSRIVKLTVLDVVGCAPAWIRQ